MAKIQGGCRHLSCRHCAQDIEGFFPYRAGEWRDRGNNTHCPTPAGDAGQLHEPERDWRATPRAYRVNFAPVPDRQHGIFVRIDYRTRAGNVASWCRYASGMDVNAARLAGEERVKRFGRFARMDRAHAYLLSGNAVLAAPARAWR